MTLRELLEVIDLDYEVKNGKIRLVDKTDVYFGNIAEDRWVAEQASVLDIIERLNIYWNDYVYNAIVDPNLNLNGKELEGYEDNGSYEELLDYCKEHEVKDPMVTVLYYLVNPNEVVLKENFIMWKRELVPNKICAVLLVLCSLPVIFLDGDATATVFMSLIAFPMFFAKENWTMFKVPKGKEEQNTRRKYVQRTSRIRNTARCYGQAEFPNDYGRRSYIHSR